MDESGVLDPTILKQCFEQGLMGVEIPTKYGGNGMTLASACIVIEELAKVDPAVSVVVDVQNTLVNKSFVKWGTEQHREKYLPRLCSDTLASFCLSEAGSGSDAFALKTTAEKKGDYYVINGSKMWITNANEAGIYLVMANVDPSKGYRGITTFIVERDTPGFKVGKKEDKLGIRASSTCELTFTDVKVPAANVLGEVGKGYRYAIELLNEGRIGIGAQMLGLAEGAMAVTIPYLQQRKQFGQSVALFQGLEFQYAQAATDIMAARLMVYNAARLHDSKLPFIKEAAMAKLFASQVAGRVSSQCVEWLGGVGFTKDFPAEKFYRDSKIGVIYEGTTNIQLRTIAEFVRKENPV
eukprot:TRINITY_DN4214_c0_g1_i1.p1 TRINITY_DN4214_c0_g1~~TRINITY_DN4214_c0_g1_i1.p1  ORF type:complete len:415 (-),score=109.62 TRINITY_DN4214_c0_g1_i1:12-1070(-)